MNKPQVAISDFTKLDLRVGRIVKAEKLENSQKLMKMEVDLGKDYGIKTILGGIKEAYDDKDLLGKKYVFIANLEPREMMGIQSQGMIMAADSGEKPVIIEVGDDIPEGTVIR